MGACYKNSIIAYPLKMLLTLSKHQGKLKTKMEDNILKTVLARLKEYIQNNEGESE